MSRLRAAAFAPWLLLFGAPALAADDDSTARPRPETPAARGDDAAERFSIGPPIACRAIRGFEDYDALPEAALTADEKLLVYYRPANYHVENSGGSYRVHLTQDGQIRRRGEKAVLLRKDKLLEYKFDIPGRPNPIYLRNTVSLKGLKPGEYDFDIILHDKLAAGPPATQTLPFKVVPAVLPKSAGGTEPSEDAPNASADAAPKPKARPKGRRPSR